MKKLFYIILCLFTISCSENTKTTKNDSDKIKALHDSAFHLISNYKLTHDLESLNEAIALTDEILRIDSTAIKQMPINNLKIQILNFQGKKKEAFFLKEKALTRSLTNIDFLTYSGIKHKIAQNIDSANIYMELAMQLNERTLQNNPNDLNAFISKIGLYIYQGKKDEAAKEIENKLNNMPEEQLLINLKENLDNMFLQSELFFEEMR